MKAIWLACCACGDYGLLQREVESRDAGAQVLRVGDLDGLVAMARAFPSRRGAAMIAAAPFAPADVRTTVARLTSEGRVGRVVVLIEALDPSDIEGLFRAGRPRSSPRTVYAATGARVRERPIPIGFCRSNPMLLLIGKPGRLALQEARVLMIVEKRKPSMVGVPGTPLHTMRPGWQRRMVMTLWQWIWGTCTA